MAYSCDDTIFEEREAPMVSPTATGRVTTSRNAHFIEPTSNSITGPTLKLPSLLQSSQSDWPIVVHFNGWHDPLEKWHVWVESMSEKHKFIWEKSGIYEAVKSSTYKIRRKIELIYGLAERWCCETSSFLFPWAEATITLEDMMILGGFSVLGSPFPLPIETNDLIIEVGLKESIKSIVKSKGRDGDEVSHSEWLDYFMGSGDDLEHEAFLTLWLSRCVLPGNEFNTINKNCFSIAIHLAKGIKIALAPVVLASLYRDLSLLKETIDKSVLEETNDKSSKISTASEKSAISLGSPIQYVQVWAWERLPPLQPRPKVIKHGQPRLAQWHCVNWSKYKNTRFVIDSAGDSFLWRPYAIAITNWVLPKYYKDEEQWVCSTGDFSEEFESLVRCLRVSELVGTESIEAYLPHRVARQFGLDQDLPMWILKSNTSPDIAWQNYTRPVGFRELYVPSRLFKGEVTTRYLKWWDNSVLDLQGETKVLSRRKRSLRLGPPPGFPGNCYWRKEISETWEKNVLISLTEGNDAKRKCDRGKEIEVGNCSKMTRKEQIGGSSSQPDGETKVLSRRKRSLRLGPPPGFPRKCYWRKEISETWKKNLLISLTKGNDAKRKCDRGKEIEVGNCSKMTRKEQNRGSSSQPEAGSIRYDVGSSSRKIESEVAKMLVELKAAVRSGDDEGSSFRESKPEFVNNISMFEKKIGGAKKAAEDEDST